MNKNSNQQYWGIFNETQKERIRPFMRMVVLVLAFSMLQYGLTSYLFCEKAYAQTDGQQEIKFTQPPPPPPKQEINSSQRVSPPPAVTQPQAANPTAAVGRSGQSMWATVGGYLGIKSTGTAPQGAWVDVKFGSGMLPKAGAIASGLGWTKTGAALTAAGAAAPNGLVIQSNGQWGGHARDANSTITGLKQEGPGQFAFAFGNSHIRNSSMTGGFGILGATGGSTIENATLKGFGLSATANGSSQIKNLSMTGAFMSAGANNRSSLTNVTQTGFGNRVSANNFSHYTNITQTGAFNMISNNATRMSNINQTGLGNTIVGNTGSSFTNIKQFGAFNQMNNNMGSSFRNINQTGVFNTMNKNVLSSFSNIKQVGFGNSMSGNKLSSFTNINQFGAFNQMNKNISSTFNNVNQSGAFNQMNKNMGSSFRNINQTGVFNTMNKNVLSSFSNIKQVGFGNSMSGNKLSSFTNINQFGAFNQMNKNIASKFNNISQAGAFNKMNNNLLSSFSNIKQVGFGNSMSGNKLSSFTNINQFGAFNQMNKNISSTFNNVNQFGAFNNINNNLNSTFSDIKQYGLGNSISGNKFADFSNIKQFGAFNNLNNNFGSSQFRATFSHINQFGAFNNINNNINSSFRGVNQFGLGNSISNNLNSSFKYISQHGAFNQMNNNINSTFKDINQTGLGHSISSNSFSDFNDINQFGAFHNMNNNLNSNFKGVIQSGFGHSLSGNNSSTFTNIVQYGALKSINNRSSANIKGMSDAQFLDAKIKFNDSFAKAGVAFLAPGLTYEQALEYRAKYGDGSNVIPYQQRPRFSSNDGVSDVTFPEGELRNFGPTWEGTQTNDLMHPNFNKQSANEWLSAIIAQPGNPRHDVANRRYAAYKEEAEAKGEKVMSPEEWSKAEIETHKKDLSTIGVLKVTVKGHGEVVVSKEYIQSVLNKSPNGIALKYYTSNLPDAEAAGKAPLSVVVVENNAAWKALYQQGGGNPESAPAGFVRNGVLYVHAPNADAIPHEAVHALHVTLGMTNNTYNPSNEQDTKLGQFSAQLEAAVNATGDQVLIAKYAALKDYYLTEYFGTGGKLYVAVEKGVMSKEDAVAMAAKYNVTVALNDGTGRTLFDLPKSEAAQFIHAHEGHVTNSLVTTEIVAASLEQLTMPIYADHADQMIRDYTTEEYKELAARFADIPQTSHEAVVKDFLMATQGHSEVAAVFAQHAQQLGISLDSGDFARFYQDYSSVANAPIAEGGKTVIAGKEVSIPDPAQFKTREAYVTAAMQAGVPWKAAGDIWYQSSNRSVIETPGTKGIEPASLARSLQVTPVPTSEPSPASLTAERTPASAALPSQLTGSPELPRMTTEPAAALATPATGLESKLSEVSRAEPQPLTLTKPESDLAFTDPTLPPSSLSLPALASPNIPEPKPAMDVSSSYNIPRTPASIDIDASVPTASAQTAVAEAPMISPFAQISEVQRAEPQPLTLTKPESDLAFTDPTLPPSNLSLPALASPNLPEPKPTLETSSSYSIAKTSVPISDINVDISVSPAQARADSSMPAQLTQVPEVARMEVPPQPVSFTRPESDMGVLTEPSLSSPALSAPNLSDTPAMAMDTPATLPSRTPAPFSELGVSANAQPDITPAGSKSIPSQAAQTPELPDMGQLADAAKSAIGQLGSAMPSFSMPTTKDIADTFGLTSEGKLDTASPALKAASSMADANVSMPTGWIDTASNAISTSMGKLGELGASLPDVSTAAVGAGGSKSIREEGLNAANRTFADNIEPLNRNINGGTSSTHVDTATGRVYHIAPKELAPVALRNSLAADYVSDDGSPGRLTVSFKEAQEMQRVQNDMQTYRTAGLNNYSALLAALGRNDYGDHGSSWNPGETVGTWKTAYNGYQYNQVLKLNDSGTGVIAVNTNNRYANTINNGLNYSGYGNSMESYRRSGPLRNFFSRRR